MDALLNTFLIVSMLMQATGFMVAMHELRTGGPMPSAPWTLGHARVSAAVSAALTAWPALLLLLRP